MDDQTALAHDAATERQTDAATEYACPSCGLPFAFRRIVESNAMGIVGQKQQFDSNCVVSSDIDFSLQSIQTHRVVVQDLRYAWVFDRWSAGGLAAVRTTEAMERSHNYLIKKWGRGIVATNRKRRSTRLSVTVRVS